MKIIHYFINSTRDSSFILTGAMVFANLNFPSIEDYTIKAAIGGAVWLGFKLLGDLINKKMKSE